MPYQEKEPFPYTEQDTAISLSVMGRASGFVADQIMPYARVNNRKFGYLIHSFKEDLQTVDDTISEKGQPNEVEFSGTRETDKVVDRGLKHTYTNEQVAEMDGKNPLGKRIMRLTNTVLRNRENRVQKVVTNPANAEKKQTLSSGSQIGDSGVKSIEIVEDMRLSMLFRANSMILSETALSKWRRAPDVVKAFHGTLGEDGMVPLEWFRQYFSMDNLIVGKALHDNAEKGLPAQIEGVWKNDFFSLAYINPAAASMSMDEDVTFGMTARWHAKGIGRNGRIAGRKQIDAGLYGAWEIRVGESVKETVLSKDCMALVQTPFK